MQAFGFINQVLCAPDRLHTVASLFFYWKAAMAFFIIQKKKEHFRWSNCRAWFTSSFVFI